MTVIVPEPIPLERPPGDPAALEDVVRSMAGAAAVLAALADDLAGPAATAPGWIGDDATAAAAQVGVVADLVRETGGAVFSATGRLSAHADLVREARHRVDQLRAEQDDDHRAAWSRLRDLDGIQAQFAYDGAGAVAIVEDLRASEDARRRRHEALLAEVADHAAQAARALRDAAAVVGGTGRPGDDARAVAHLAVLLPGWGAAELEARGTALAAALVGGPVTPDEMNAAALDATAYAGAPAFADAFLTGLGVEGVRWLLTALGLNSLGPRSAVAGALSAAFGAARSDDSGRDPVATVVNAPYAGDGEESPGVLMAGMALVLAAGARSPAGGPRPPVVADWARQMVLGGQSPTVGARPIPADWPGELLDPAALALRILADRGTPEAAAALLADRDVWQALLARSWIDGGAALGEVVEQAGRDAGAAGVRAVRAGLEVIGTGFPLGDPSDRTIGRDTVASLSPSIAHAVAAQVTVAVEALSVGVDGRLGDREDALRGLGYLTLDRRAAAAIEGALFDWARNQPAELRGTGPLAPLPAVAVPGAVVAAEEYGQRLAHALNGFEQQESAETREWVWDHTFGLVGFAPGLSGLGAGVVEGYAAILLDMDGTWDAEADRGRRFDADDAAEVVGAGLAPDRRADAIAVEEQARAAYERTHRALGAPAAPVPPAHDYLEPIVDGAAGAAVERMKISPLIQRYLPR